MEGLICTARLVTPVALQKSYDIHLDALLAWAWISKNDPDILGAISGRTSRSDLVNPTLPLAVIPIGEWSVSLCTSWELPESALLGSAYWTRRKDSIDIGFRERKVSPSSPERNQLNRADLIGAGSVSWFCWGEGNGILDLLLLVTNLGGLRAHGYGEIASWEVESIGIDPTWLWERDGFANRNLPLPICRGHNAADVEALAFQAPYWLPCMRAPGIRSGSSVVLGGTAGELIRKYAV